MGHNPSRNPFRRAKQLGAVAAQYDVDQYKARSIWGPWRKLPPATRERYFNADEVAWLNRYGARLDELACLTVESKNAHERHFVGVCLGHHPPASDRERLWLRAQMVVRYEVSLEQAARCGEAERVRDALAAKLKQTLADLRECESEQFAVIRAKWDVEEIEQRIAAKMRILSLRNVERVPTWLFPVQPALRLYTVIGGVVQSPI